MSRRLNERISKIARQLDEPAGETIVWAPWLVELMAKPPEEEPTTSPAPAPVRDPLPAPTTPPLTPIADDAGITEAQCPQCGSRRS
jgi:hypothetical protein